MSTEITLEARKTRRRSSRRGGGPKRVPWLLAAPGVALVIAYFVAVGAGAWYSFTDWNGVGHARWIGFQNFRQIFSDPATRGALWHTLELAFAFVVLVNAIGLALALGLNKAVKSRNLLRSLFFAPVVLSPLAVAFVWQYIFDQQGALNWFLRTIGEPGWQRPWLGSPTWALWTILVVMVWQFSGLTMVLYLAGLQGVPDELLEAAAVDGATTGRRFWRVTLPLLAPAVTVAATLTLIIGLRVFDQVLALTAGGPVDASETLGTQVYKQTFVLGHYGYGAALALVLTSLVAVMAVAQTVILRRREAVI